MQKKFSVGSNGDIGTRNAMPLFNLNWAKGYFWEGRQPTLESLIEDPMEAHNEMDLDIETAVIRLEARGYLAFISEEGRLFPLPQSLKSFIEQ